MQNPTFTIFSGAMFSSKTSQLLMELERHKYQHKRIAVFKPEIDVRYSDKDVVSHSGWTHPATTVRTGADIVGALAELEEPPDVVAVDEAFMISGIAEVLVWLFRTGISVVVSTLDLSATGKPFAEVEKMLPWATRVKKCAAVCEQCGADAFYTHKKAVSGEEEIHVGGVELYSPRCFSHHPTVNIRPNLHEE